MTCGGLDDLDDHLAEAVEALADRAPASRMRFNGAPVAASMAPHVRSSDDVITTT